MYSKKVLQHFLHPKFMGKIKNPNGIGKVGNPACGDTMELFVKIKTKKEKGGAKEVIDDIKFETLGCAAAIASSEVACELIKGKTIDEALKLRNKEIIKALDGLPAIKIHCSLLAVEALKAAIKNYKLKQVKS